MSEQKMYIMTREEVKQSAQSIVDTEDPVNKIESLAEPYSFLPVKISRSYDLYTLVALKLSKSKFFKQ
jgi:hypothetical protein